MRYRKKPVEVRAFQLGIDDTPDWAMKSNAIYIPNLMKCEMYIRTLEGTIKASKGDYIIEGVHKELYPCKADIFEQTYEQIEK